MGICAKKLNSSEEMTVVFDNGCFDFDVISDFNQTIHLICQDKNGNVMYFIYTNSVWQKKCLLVSKNATPYTKSFKLIKVKNLLFTLYTIVKDSRSMLVCQHLNSENTPIVCDYITNAPRSFFTYLHTNSDIDIFYQNSSGVLGYKKYIWSKKDFGAFCELCDGGISPFAVSESEFAALCGNKIIFFDGNTQYEIYNSFGNELSSIVCYKTNSELFIMWQQGHLTFYSKRLANGFSPPSRFLVPFGAASLFEIKTASENPIYLYASVQQNKINLLSPSSVINLEDFFSFSKTDKLDIIMQKLDKIYSLLGGSKYF